MHFNEQASEAPGQDLPHLNISCINGILGGEAVTKYLSAVPPSLPPTVRKTWACFTTKNTHLHTPKAAPQVPKPSPQQASRQLCSMQFYTESPHILNICIMDLEQRGPFCEGHSISPKGQRDVVSLLLFQPDFSQQLGHVLLQLAVLRWCPVTLGCHQLVYQFMWQVEGDLVEGASSKGNCTSAHVAHVIRNCTNMQILPKSKT